MSRGRGEAWKPEQIQMAFAMQAQGVKPERIAADLGIGLERVRDKLRLKHEHVFVTWIRTRPDGLDEVACACGHRSYMRFGK